MNDNRSSRSRVGELIKKDWQKSLLIILLVLSLSYLAWDFWGKQKDNWMLRGYAVAIGELVEVANDPACSPFPVQFDEQTVNLINYECLLEEGDSVDITNGLFIPNENDPVQ